MKYDKDLLSLGAFSTVSGAAYFGDRLVGSWQWTNPPNPFGPRGGLGYGCRVNSGLIYCGDYWHSQDDGASWYVGGIGSDPLWGMQAGLSPYKGLLAWYSNYWGTGYLRTIADTDWWSWNIYTLPSGYWEDIEVATDGVVHFIEWESGGLKYRRSEDFGETWSSGVIVIPGVSSPYVVAKVHGVGDKVAIALLTTAYIGKSYFGGVDALAGAWPGGDLACIVDLFYETVDLICLVSLDEGQTWSAQKRTIRDDYTGMGPEYSLGAYSTGNPTRWIVTQPPYVGWVGPGPALVITQVPYLALGSVGDTLWICSSCYEINKSTLRTALPEPVVIGLHYSYDGPQHTPCLLFEKSEGWSGEFVYVDHLTRAALLTDLQARTNALGDKCYMAGSDGVYLNEVFANGTPEDWLLQTSAGGLTFNMNYQIRYKPPAGYSFWW